MTYDPTSRKDIRRAEKAADRLAADRLLFLRAALDTAPGRAWFYHFLADCHCWDGTFIGDPYRDAFSAGERNIGLRIFAEITLHCADQYLLMVREENVRLASHSAATERSRSQDSGRDVEGRTEPFDDPNLNLWGDDPAAEGALAQ